MAVDQVALLTTRRDAVLTQIAALTSTTMGGRPDAVGPGLNLREIAYRESLYDELVRIDTMLAKYDVAASVFETQEH